MNLWKSIVGSIRIRIISASLERVITDINTGGIPIMNAVWVDDLTFEATILRSDLKRLEEFVQLGENKLVQLHRTGIYWRFLALIKRPVLTISLLVYAAIVALLPTRIFFVTVDGNITVPSEMIISQAESCGVRFGASKMNMRNETIKNTLLSSIPQLQWVGINTYGCVAAISVRERSGGPSDEISRGVCSIVAKCDALIKEMTVTKGDPRCRVGDVVTKGQLLVSGYTDCGIQIKATAAEAEIYGQTIHHITATSPYMRQFRGEKIRKTQRYRLFFGKKLINLWKDSGISDTRCVKIYDTKYLTLPGGFQLPLGAIVETRVEYELRTDRLPEEAVLLLCTSQGRRYVTEHMIAGQILSENTVSDADEQTLDTLGQYICYEMIGQMYNEEIIDGSS